MSTAVFLEPLDVLLLRGNRLFGEPGSHGESLVPPWPSVAAGALRSRMLVDAAIDPGHFAKGEVSHPELGTPARPGAFRLTRFTLAQRQSDGRIEGLYTPPADLILSEGEDGAVAVHRLRATPVPEHLSSSSPLPELPILAQAERRKPLSGYWLRESGWRRYLGGETPKAADLVHSSRLWGLDPRVGIGLDPATGRPSDGRLFTVQAVAMHAGVGFIAEASHPTLPKEGSLRFGGDGRAVRIHQTEADRFQPDHEALAKAGRCRMVLTAPACFAAGWLPTGTDAGASGERGLAFALHGVHGHLRCAAVARAETVSGWDLARQQPKPAQRFAPAGSVYWLQLAPGTTGAALRKLAESGLWLEPCEDPARRAEGFNTVSLAPY